MRFIHLLFVLLDGIVCLFGRNLVLFAREFRDLADEVDAHRIAGCEERDVVP